MALINLSTSLIPSLPSSTHHQHLLIPKPHHHHHHHHLTATTTTTTTSSFPLLRASFSGSFFEGGDEEDRNSSSFPTSTIERSNEIDDDDDDDIREDGDFRPGFAISAAAAALAIGDEGPGGEPDEPQCPPGLRQYESVMMLRPDVGEEGRLQLIQDYEELLVTGGAMYVQVFNRGVIPLAYPIKKLNRDGEANVYYDAICILFTYFTKAESMGALEGKLKGDFDVIRSTSFRIHKPSYYNQRY